MSTVRDTARQMVSAGRGILAADESIGTMSSRLEKAGIAPTEENRRAYRELLVATPQLSDAVSGVILSDETFSQQFTDGRPFPVAMSELGLLVGIKVDTGAKPLANATGELVTEGLDGLRPRLADYAERGAKFAKWRAVITIGDGLPSDRAVHANAHALARYAALCQEAGIVPIVEPEVMMDGDHDMDRTSAVTSAVVTEVMRELRAAGVDLAGIVLKPNMVLPGKDSTQVVTPAEAAEATVSCLRGVVPDEVAGIAFLSGGQSPASATANLAAMQAHETPWPLTFSFGRALVDPALAAWQGSAERVPAGQQALAQRVQLNAAALQGTYNKELEQAAV